MNGCNVSFMMQGRITTIYVKTWVDKRKLEVTIWKKYKRQDSDIVGFWLSKISRSDKNSPNGKKV